MFDIDVVNNRRRAVIEPGSLAARYFKQVKDKLIMKRLSSESGKKPFLTTQEFSMLARGKATINYAVCKYWATLGVLEPVFKEHSLAVLRRDFEVQRQDDPMGAHTFYLEYDIEGWELTPLMLNALNELKEGAEFVEIGFP